MIIIPLEVSPSISLPRSTNIKKAVEKDIGQVLNQLTAARTDLWAALESGEKDLAFIHALSTNNI